MTLTWKNTPCIPGGRALAVHAKPRPLARWRGGALVGMLAAGLSLSACATIYDLTLMPRDSGKITYGTAKDLGNGQANVTLVVGERLYTGNWVQVTPDATVDYVGASAWGWGGWGPFGQVSHTTGGATAKALLQAPDGSGMRCDLYGLNGGSGAGKCTDDKGQSYDVQIRSRTAR